MKRIERLPDACCKVFCQVHRSEKKKRDGSLEDFNLVLILGMFAVDGRTIYVELPFSDFAPNFGNVADFEALAFEQLRHCFLTNRQRALIRNPDPWSKPTCNIARDGKLTLELCGMYSIYGSDGSSRTVANADIPFSDFAENFASIGDFERLVINLLDFNLPRVEGR